MFDFITEKQARKYRVPLLIVGIIQDFFMSGIIFGWAPLQTLLYKEGVYQQVCSERGHEPRSYCDAQDLQLNLIFTFGSFATILSSTLLGPVLDKCGPKVTTLVATTLVAAGSLLFSYSSYKFQAYIPAVVLIGIGGPGMDISLLHLSNLFSGKESTIISIFSGTWGASSFVFYIFLSANKEFGFDIAWLFRFYTMLLAFFFFVSFFVWPNKTFRNAVVGSVIYDKLNSEPEPDEKDPLLESSEKWSTHFKKSDFKSQVLSYEYVLFIAVMMVPNISNNYFLGSLKLALMAMGDTGNYLNIFYFIFPFGFVFIPLIGFILDKGKFAVGMGVLFLCTSLYNALLIVPVLPLQVFTFVVYSFSCVLYGAVLFAYLPKMFGFQYFGKLLGIATLTSALCELLQNVLLRVSLHTFNGNFKLMNIIILSATGVTYLFPFYLYSKVYKPLYGRKAKSSTVN